jgi:hypothetical protein
VYEAVLILTAAAGIGKRRHGEPEKANRGENHGLISFERVIVE